MKFVKKIGGSNKKKEEKKILQFLQQPKKGDCDLSEVENRSCCLIQCILTSLKWNLEKNNRTVRISLKMYNLPISLADQTDESAAITNWQGDLTGV